MTRRWISAVGAAAALGFLTLPVTPTFSLEPVASLFNYEVSAAATCDADAKPAPLDYTLRDVGGEEVDLASLKGNVILLNFWATWCGPCKIEIPWFVEFQETYGDKGLVVLGLSVDDTPEQMRPFIAEYQVNYPMLVGLGREDFQEAYGPVWGLPITFMIDREGTICRKHIGIATKEEFEKDLADLL
jgi:peroxiredoxin